MHTRAKVGAWCPYVCVQGLEGEGHVQRACAEEGCERVSVQGRPPPGLMRVPEGCPLFHPGPSRWPWGR